MDIVANLKKSFELYAKNFVPVFLATLITALVSGITFGLLAGPLLGGLFVFLRKTSAGEKPGLGVVFSRFDKFLPALLVMIIAFVAGLVISIIGEIPVIGKLFNLAASSLLSLIAFMAIAFVVDKDLGPVDAVKRSIQAFLTEPLMDWLYSLAIFILGGSGALYFVFPVVFPMPFAVIGASLAYNE